MKHYTGPAQAVPSAEELSGIPAACRVKALGAVPRLGLGSRTTTLSWPTVFRFLSEKRLCANAIQNSVARELMPLEMLHDPTAKPTTLQPGLGQVPVGHTGSTIEGLLEWGMLSAANSGYDGPGFGADADHLPVFAPGSSEWAKTVSLIKCSRGYSHFTLDVGALTEWAEGPVARLANVPAAIAAAMECIEEVRSEPFDLEISLDESPGDIAPEAAATTPDEASWLLTSLSAIGIKAHYIAPHFGFTKGSDVADLSKLNTVAGALHSIACEHGALLSIHSGDNLSSTTRQTLGRACSGKLLFKVAPAIQDLFIETVLKHEPEIAKRWKAWTLNYVRHIGAQFPSDEVAFHKYAFAAFGVRNNDGDFEMRDLLYGVETAARNAFEVDLSRYLQVLATDLMLEQT